MSRLVKFFLILCCGAGPASFAALDEYINWSSVTNAQVDARSFVNNGAFYVQTTDVPWDSQNTTNFLNSNLMFGSVGFRFELVSSSGARGPASRFVNTRNANIAASDGLGFLAVDDGSFVGLGSPSSYVLINASNIVNYGNIRVGASGLIRLTGDNVDLSGGTLIVDPIGTADTFGFFGGFSLTSTNFIPDAGLYDLSWGTDNITNMAVANIVLNVNPTIISTPFFRTTNSTFRCIDGLLLTNAATWVLTRVVSATNVTVQAVAVQTSDTNIQADVRFINQTYPDFVPAVNDYLSPVLELRSVATNLITLRPFTNTLYLIDQLTSATNYGLSQNLLAGTFRPSSFILSRSAPLAYIDGATSNDVFTVDMFDHPAFSNRIVTNLYAAYSAQVENTTARLPAAADLSVANLPGRIEVRADELNMNRVRIRGEGSVSIKATNLVDARNAIVDVANIKYDLSSVPPAGGGQARLTVENLVRENVQRFRGGVSAFSMSWTNLVASPDTNVGTVEVHFSLLVVDASEMRTVQDVVAHEMILRAPGDGQVVLNDAMTVSDRMIVDAPSLTINDRLTLGQGLSWSPTNFLRLVNLTNNGFVQLTDLGEYRRSDGGRYASFVNRGRIFGFGHQIYADYFENSGSLVSTQFFRQPITNICQGTVAFLDVASPSIGSINVDATVAKLEGGNFATAGDVVLTGSVLKMNRFGSAAGGGLYLNVVDTLTDSGPEGANFLEVADGIHMDGSRPQGDLLGTHVRSSAAEFGIVEHSWSAVDRGATAAGFDNNIALGELNLAGEVFSEFRFSPGVPGSALYVDMLVIGGDQASSWEKLTNGIALSGLNIYYGDVQSENSNFTAETLNGLTLGNGRLVWVPEFAGPRSGVDILAGDGLPGGRMNRALRESRIMDSDGDGIPNYFDAYPLVIDTTLTLQAATLSGSGGMSFAFAAKASVQYVVEYAEDLNNPVWKPLPGGLRASSAGGVIHISDPINAGNKQRFFRVRLAQ